MVTGDAATVRIGSTSLVRGTLHEPEQLPVVESVAEEFGYAEIPVVSRLDLYGANYSQLWIDRI